MQKEEAHLSRRGFLKASVLGVSAAALGGPLVMRGSAASTAANRKLNLAVIGCGGQGRSDLRSLLSTDGVNLVALCDTDAAQIEQARAVAGENGGAQAKAYDDYRRLLDDSATFDAVLIATPDHWHAYLCKAFMKAGKHIYCEKPLTHSIGEAREIRQLAHQSRVVTQMGNQGSASDSLRRCVEIIKAGALGQIETMYSWGIGVDAREGSADGEDPIPQGFNWDMWVGPSAMRPFKARVYHPAAWRGWFDFGNGGLADFGCHVMNLPVRALDLDYPERLVVNAGPGVVRPPDRGIVEFHFGARHDLAPVVLHWMGSQKPPADVMRPLTDLFGDKVPDGLLILGEKGCIHTHHWNNDGVIRLEGEPELQRVIRHTGTRDIPKSLPRIKGHHQEWVDACRGHGRTFSNFEVGGKLTEIVLAGVVALRAGKSLDWDGKRMRARSAPETDRFVHSPCRQTWLT